LPAVEPPRGDAGEWRPQRGGSGGLHQGPGAAAGLHQVPLQPGHQLHQSGCSQGGSEQLSDSAKPAETKQKSAGHVWQHLGSPEDCALHDRPTRTLPGRQHRRLGPTHQGLQCGHMT
ncbi:hypothetical protein COCON_G00093300, partial [Conger conger]